MSARRELNVHSELFRRSSIRFEVTVSESGILTIKIRPNTMGTSKPDVEPGRMNLLWNRQADQVLKKRKLDNGQRQDAAIQVNISPDRQIGPVLAEVDTHLEDPIYGISLLEDLRCEQIGCAEVYSTIFETKNLWDPYQLQALSVTLCGVRGNVRLYLGQRLYWLPDTACYLFGQVTGSRFEIYLTIGYIRSINSEGDSRTPYTLCLAQDPGEPAFLMIVANEKQIVSGKDWDIVDVPRGNKKKLEYKVATSTEELANYYAEHRERQLRDDDPLILTINKDGKKINAFSFLRPQPQAAEEKEKSAMKQILKLGKKLTSHSVQIVMKQ